MKKFMQISYHFYRYEITLCFPIVQIFLYQLFILILHLNKTLIYQACWCQIKLLSLFITSFIISQDNLIKVFYLLLDLTLYKTFIILFVFFIVLFLSFSFFIYDGIIFNLISRTYTKFYFWTMK